MDENVILEISTSEHDFEEDPETKHFKRIANAFRYYKKHSLAKLERAHMQFEDLPTHHRQLVPSYKEKLQEISLCVQHNYEIIKCILGYIDQMFENMQSNVEEDALEEPAKEFDMDKVKSTLKQFVRDWSAEGQGERDSCYLPVIQQVQALFPEQSVKKGNVKVLVPGAGLGRLAWEIAKQGYTCQGNEFSLFMLFASNYVLNKCDEANMQMLFPWALQFCNIRKHKDQIQSITFPDVNPADLPETERDIDDIPPFSMAAGDFLEIYKEPDYWDCVCTVFFIDTAHNVMDYIETIWNILKPGGYWINLGPLLYHFAEMPNETSIELNYDELREVIQKFNFEIVKEDEHVKTTYTGNPNSMLQYNYDSVFFVARKPQAAYNSSPLAAAYMHTNGAHKFETDDSHDQ